MYPPSTAASDVMMAVFFLATKHLIQPAKSGLADAREAVLDYARFN